jgi:hypothetical protein
MQYVSKFWWSPVDLRMCALGGRQMSTRCSSRRQVFSSIADVAVFTSCSYSATQFCMYPRGRKCEEVKSGDAGGRVIGPSFPMRLPGNWWSRKPFTGLAYIIWRDSVLLEDAPSWCPCDCTIFTSARLPTGKSIHNIIGGTCALLHCCI